MAEYGIERWKIDMWQANFEQLESPGVTEASISVEGFSTADNLELCYSHRAEGAETGRLAAAIRLGRPAAGAPRR
jgi:copper oxidase (laccase) domain-containing protein